MYVMIFDTHNILRIKERLQNNLRSMGYSSGFLISDRYFFAYEGGSTLTHGDTYDSLQQHHGRDVRFYDCLWMTAPEQAEEGDTITTTAPPIPTLRTGDNREWIAYANAWSTIPR